MVVDFPDEPEWTRALATLPSYSFFATPRFINACSKHLVDHAQPRVARVIDADGSWLLAAFLQCQASRLGTCTLVGAPERCYAIAGRGRVGEGWLDALRAALAGPRVESIELTIGPGVIIDERVSPRFDISSQDTWVIELNSGLDGWLSNRLDKRVRRQIRKSEADGVHTVACGIEGLDDFYALYERVTETDWTRSRRYSKAFLRDLICADGPGNVSLYLTYHGNRLIAGGFLVRGGTEALAWIGAMDRECAALNGNANRHHAVIRDLIALGATSYNLGAAPGLPLVAAFKRKLGAEPRRYHTVVWRNRFWSLARAWQGRRR